MKLINKLKMKKEIYILTILIIISATVFSQSTIPEGYELKYSTDFKTADELKNFEFSDPEVWKLSPDCEGTHTLESTGKGKYEPPVRSPLVIALVAHKQFGDFVLEANIQQTGREYGHRDMCIFFNYVDSSHFYYVHIASQTDDHAHNIFIVNGEPRTKITLKNTNGVNWGNGWHKVRLVRNTQSGKIELYFDDMKNPIMIAEDKIFQKGYIGFGSFDDLGKVDNIRICSPTSTEKKANIFSSK